MRRYLAPAALLCTALAVSGAAGQAFDTPPHLKAQGSPDYPWEMLKRGRRGEVMLRARIGIDGVISDPAVVRSTDPQFDKPAIRWLMKQKAEPATKGGRPVESNLFYKVIFSIGGRTYEPATFLTPGAPAYPESFRDTGAGGDVTVRYIVQRDGSIHDPIVLASPHPVFEQAVVEWLLRQKAAPALEEGESRDKPVDTQATQTFHFAPNGSASGQVVRPPDYGLVTEFPSEGLPSGWPTIALYDTLPKVKYAAPVVYPFAQLRQGKEGSAKVRALVGPEGTVHGVSVLEASEPEFGEAVEASIEAWIFEPARSAGQDVWSVVTKTQQFAVGNPQVYEGPSALRLLRAESDDAAGIASLNDLDAAPKAVYRPPPIYPHSFRENDVKGEVKIEYLIDRDGLVQLPRIVSAERPEFGWAAVTAAARWRFTPPRRKGEPVDARAQVVLDFKLSNRPTKRGKFD